MRVLAFIEALGVTGPARNLLALAPHIDLHLATFRRRSLGSAHREGVERFVSAARARGIPVHIIDERSRFDWRVADAVVRLIDDAEPDVVESHHLKSHAVIALARMRTAVPWVAWHHGYTRTDLKVVAYNHVDRWSLPRADLVVTTCFPFARRLANLGVADSRLDVVHNAVASGAGVVSKETAAARLRLTDRRVVLAVGRLSREKGHDLLIEACHRITGPLREQLVLVLAGEGPARPRLERQARRLGIVARFDGHQADVSAYYAAADVFVLPSRSEGSPNVLLEAMAAGAPIVASAAGGVTEIVDRRSALLVPPGDPVSLGTAIGRLLAFPEVAHRLGDAARETARRFSPERRARHVLSLYRTLLDRNVRGVAR